MSVTSIRLQAELEQSLVQLAKKSARSKNWLVNQAVKEYIENQELAQQRWLETLPALESVRSGKSLPAQNIEEWVSSWGTDDEVSAPDI